MKRIHLALLALPLFFAFVSAQEADRAEAPKTIADLAWMAGHWSGTTDGIEGEEAWLAPKAGIMLGLHRDVATKKERLLSFEYLRIEQRKSAIIYVASPSGGSSTEFSLIESGDNSATFENPEHDFPKRILYRRTKDTLHARIEGDNGESMEWKWELQP